MIRCVHVCACGFRRACVRGVHGVCVWVRCVCVCCVLRVFVITVVVCRGKCVFRGSLLVICNIVKHRLARAMKSQCLVVCTCNRP